MTHDLKDVERVKNAIGSNAWGKDWPPHSTETIVHDMYDRMARAAISAMPSQEVEVTPLVWAPWGGEWDANGLRGTYTVGIDGHSGFYAYFNGDKLLNDMGDTFDRSTPSHCFKQAQAHHDAAIRSCLVVQEVTAQDAAKVLLDACPNPIFDSLKYPLMGEFGQTVCFVDKDGDEDSMEVTIEWAVTKEIITAALRALSGEQT